MTYLTAVTSIMTIITIASVPQTYIRALPILNFRMAFTETSKLKYAVLYILSIYTSPSTHFQLNSVSKVLALLLVQAAPC